MKNLIIILILLFPIVINCTKNDELDSLMQIKLIAWNYLNEQAKSTVTIDWRQASVNETTYNEKSVYAVRFNTSDDAILGPIIIYIDVLTKVIVGQASRM